MRIGVIGAGQIGGGIASLPAPAGHEPCLPAAVIPSGLSNVPQPVDAGPMGAAR